MDDESAPEKSYPLSPAKMSKTPSWVMLGFLLGALFVWMLPREAPPPPTPAIARKPVPPAEPARTAITTLTKIEAVFEAWGQYATWDGDLTEVALWNSETKSFSEFYEIRRTREALYYRSIPRLTRRVIRHGKPLPDSPLQFTETEEQYREWRENGRTERPPESTSGTTGNGFSSTGTGRASRASENVKFRGIQVFDIAILDQVHPPKVDLPILPSGMLTPGAGRDPSPETKKKE